MKIVFSLIDDHGDEYTGSAILATVGKERRLKETPKLDPAPRQEITFAGNPRAFMKRYAANLTGPQKFTLLLAYLARGDRSKTITYAQIYAAWNKMTGILGKSNPAQSIRAKDNGWVDTTKAGVYVLCPNWKDALHR
jgi:hypothetical protein